MIIGILLEFVWQTGGSESKKNAKEGGLADFNTNHHIASFKALPGTILGAFFF